MAPNISSSSSSDSEVPKGNMIIRALDMTSVNSTSSYSPFGRALGTTSTNLSSLSLTSAQADRELALADSRKRSRSDNLDIPLEEGRQAQPARTNHYISTQQDEPSTVGRRPMTARRGAPFRFPVGGRTMYRQEQERIANTFANISVSAPPAPPAPAPAASLSANRATQPITTPSSPQLTSRKRPYAEDSDADDEASEYERPAKVRCGGGPSTLQRNPIARTNVRAAAAAYRSRFGHGFFNHDMVQDHDLRLPLEAEVGVLANPDAVESHNSEDESLSAQGELSTARNPAARNDESNGRDLVIIDLTYDDTDSEAEAELEDLAPPPSSENIEESEEAEWQLFYQYDQYDPSSPSRSPSSPSSRQIHRGSVIIDLTSDTNIEDKAEWEEPALINSLENALDDEEKRLWY